jgi:hypothetical protein
MEKQTVSWNRSGTDRLTKMKEQLSLISESKYASSSSAQLRATGYRQGFLLGNTQKLPKDNLSKNGERGRANI